MHMIFRKTLMALLLAFFCAGCTGSPTAYLLARHVGPDLSYRDFVVCKDYGCTTLVPMALKPEEWAQVKALFVTRAADAPSERATIAQAVALFEKIVGPKAGTVGDEAGADLILTSKQEQQDCIDESFNTTTYITLLEWNGLLHWHHVGEPARRGKFVDLEWPHNTATVVEISTDNWFAIDSWFHKNGELPEIVPVQVWLDGWRPEGA
jgi:hypothetical protein